MAIPRSASFGFVAPLTGILFGTNALAGCSSETLPSAPLGTGGSTTVGGAGGAGPTGGSESGGTTSGGNASGGSAAGGVATGGSAAGGVATGGSAAGSSGGSTTGGSAGSGGGGPSTTSICGTAAENDSATLTCPPGAVITSIDFASYGTPTGVCGSFMTSSTCHSAQSESIVTSACLGQSSCTVQATNATFGGDPCSMIVKNLSIQATCAGGMSSTGGGGGAAGAGSMGGRGGAGTGGGGNGGAGTGGAPAVGSISITDRVPGFASVAGGTTGGGTDLGSAVTVSSMSQLQSAAAGSNRAVVLVQPGNYSGTLTLGSNKTIIGTAPGVTVTGNIAISGGNVSNVVIRNIAIRGPVCNSNDECRSGSDAVYIGNGAHHVWLDHMDIADGQDGNCDVTQGGDYVTVSWAHFHYTYAKEHRLSNLIAGSDDKPDSVGKLRITYMNSHWGERVDQRQPRGRFGNVHMLNNYHNTGGGQIHGVGVDMALIAENSVYDENRSIFTDMGSPRGWRGIGNQGTGSDLNASRGTVFDIPYDYTAMPTSQVVAAVMSSRCGAGNTCTLAR